MNKEPRQLWIGVLGCGPISQAAHFPGIAFAHRFIREERGQMLALKAWYCDSTYRYEEMGGV